MKHLISGTEVENSRKKLTNHSGRKTLIKKLKDAGVAESCIIKVSGHSTTAGLRNYDPEDEVEFQNMSNALQQREVDFVVSPHLNKAVSHPSTPKKKPCINPSIPSFAPVLENSANPQLHGHSAKPVFNPFPSFASIFENKSNTIQFNPNPNNQPVYNFYICQVNIGSATPMQGKPKRKRLRVYSDSSSEDES